MTCGWEWGQRCNILGWVLKAWLLGIDVCFLDAIAGCVILAWLYLGSPLWHGNHLDSMLYLERLAQSMVKNVGYNLLAIADTQA